MKKTEILAFVAAAIGVAVGVGLRIWLWMLPPWVYFVVGALAAGGAYKALVELKANESVVDSETINRKR